MTSRISRHRKRQEQPVEVVPQQAPTKPSLPVSTSRTQRAPEKPTTVHKPLVERKQHQHIGVKEVELPRPFTSSFGSVTPLGKDVVPKPSDVVDARMQVATNPTHTFVRSTVGGICEQASTTKQTQIPLGIIFQPMASQEVARYEVARPERCPRCMAYLNSMFRFEANYATCFLCFHKFQRNSLQIFPQEPIYDIVIKEANEYTRKRKDKIHFLLCVQLGFKWNSVLFNAIKAALPNMGSTVSLGFLLFDRSIWAVRTVRGGYKQRVELPSYDSPFLPLDQKHMFMNVHTQSEQLLELIDWIAEESTKADHKCPTGFGSVLAAGLKAFQNYPGRLLLFFSSPASLGYGRIQPRSKQLLRRPFLSQSKDYQTLAEAFLAKRVMVDYYVFGTDVNRYFDLSTSHPVCGLTGGTINYYSFFSEQFSGQRLYYQLYHNLTKSYGFDVEFTCRFSAGLVTNSIITGAGIIEERDSALGGVDADKTIAFTFEQDEKCPRPACQFAMLHTNTWGERVIRVINYSFKVLPNHLRMFQSIDYLALAALIGRRLAPSLFKNQLAKVSDQLRVKVEGIFNSYKSLCGRPSLDIFSAAPSMQLLPLYSYCFKKSPLFTTEPINPDSRIVEYVKFMNEGFWYLAHHFYPRVYRLDNILSQPEVGREENGAVILPDTCSCSGFLLSRMGVYLFDDHDWLYLLVGEFANPEVLSMLFGTPDIAEVGVGEVQLYEQDNELSRRVLSVVGELRGKKQGAYPPVMVVSRTLGDFYKERCRYLLKEEGETTVCPYSEYLGQIQKAVTR